jgi:hypothetical protein
MSASLSTTDSKLEREPQHEPRLVTPLLLFVATVVCVFQAGGQLATTRALPSPFAGFFDWQFLASGAAFAVPFLAILVTHEFGHYVAARVHGLPASLPYFIPLPGVGLFGTFGALIGMHDEIRSRNAVLDLGASGPLAGLFVAFPTLVWGLAHSTIEPVSRGLHGLSEGQSILYWLLKRGVFGPIPADHDVLLHPTALAGWAGLWLTMLNLFPWGQLDGGHIAYALFGERQHRIARWCRRGLLLLFAYNFVRLMGPVLLSADKSGYANALQSSLFWLIWFGVLALVERMSGTDEHPPFEPGPLSRGRRIVAWACLALFVLLFMPTPMTAF